MLVTELVIPDSESEEQMQPVSTLPSTDVITSYSIHYTKLYDKYKTTLDGYIISTGTDGFYQYGTIDGQGHFVPSQVRVNNISQRTSTERSFIKTLSKKIDFSILDSQSRMAKATAANQTNTATKGSYPLTGSPKSLVILVNFSDKNFATASPDRITSYNVCYTKLLRIR